MSTGCRRKRDQITQCIDVWASELVGAAKRIAIVERIDEGLRHIADPDRLKSGSGTANRQHRKKFRQFPEEIQKIVFRAKDDRRSEYRPVQIRLAYRRVAIGLA